MQRAGAFGRRNIRLIIYICIVLILLSGLLLTRLGNLAGGLSSSEVQSASAAVGWHGIYHQPFYLPLKLARSVVFFIWPSHGQTLTRLPNVVFGALAIIEFGWLVRLWHGRRPGLFAIALFATAAWVLHASRLASYDVMYLWLTTTLLLIDGGATRMSTNLIAWFGGLLAVCMCLFIPGAIWFLLIEAYFIREPLIEAWKDFKAAWIKPVSITIPLLFVAFLVLNLTRAGQLKQWVGLPAHFPTIKLFAKHIVAVPVHLFIRGPNYPEIWLGRAPLLDVFSLVACLIGIYFYTRHSSSSRSRLLAAFFILGWLLVALGGPVGFSVLVPLMYLMAAMGMAYLLHEWLKVFPDNPLARGTGIALLSLLVAFAAIYNLRAYFVAWPHNPTTQAIFPYRR